MPYTVGRQLVDCQHDGCQSRTNICHPVCPIHAACWYMNSYVISNCNICTLMLVTTLDVNSHNIQRIQAVGNLFRWIAILTEFVRHNKLAFNINIELRCLTRRSYSEISSEEWGNLLQLFIMHGTMSQFLPDGRSRYMASFPSCGLYDVTNIFQMRSQNDIHLSWDPKWEVPRSFQFRQGYPISMDPPRIPPPQQIQIQDTKINPEQFQPIIWYSGDNYPLVSYDESMSEIRSQTHKSDHRKSSETLVFSCEYRFHFPTKDNSGSLKQNLHESENAYDKRLRCDKNTSTNTWIDTSDQSSSTSKEDLCIQHDGWRHLPQDCIILQNERNEMVGFKNKSSGKIHKEDIDIKEFNNDLYFRYKAVEMSVTAKTARTVATCRTALLNLTHIFPNFGMSKDTETISKYPASRFLYQALQMAHIDCDMWSKERYAAWLETGKLNIIEMPVFIIAIQNEGLRSLKQCLLEPVLKNNIANEQLCIDEKLLSKNLLISDFETRKNLWDILSTQCVNEYVLSCMGELQSLRMSDKANTAVQAVTEVIHAGIYQMAFLVRKAMVNFFAARKALRDEALKDRKLSVSNVALLIESSPYCQFLFPETEVEVLVNRIKSHPGPSGVLFERQVVTTKPVNKINLNTNFQFNAPPGYRGRGSARGWDSGRGNTQHRQ